MPSSMRRNRTLLPTCASTGLGFLTAILSLAIKIGFENWKLTLILDEIVLLAVHRGAVYGRQARMRRTPYLCGASQLMRRKVCTRQASQHARAKAITEISRIVPS